MRATGNCFTSFSVASSFFLVLRFSRFFAGLGRCHPGFSSQHLHLPRMQRRHQSQVPRREKEPLHQQSELGEFLLLKSYCPYRLTRIRKDFDLFQAAAGFRLGFHRHLLHQSPHLFQQLGDSLTSQDEGDSPKTHPKVNPGLRTGLLLGPHLTGCQSLSALS